MEAKTKHRHWIVLEVERKLVTPETRFQILVISCVTCGQDIITAADIFFRSVTFFTVKYNSTVDPYLSTTVPTFWRRNYFF